MLTDASRTVYQTVIPERGSWILPDITMSKEDGTDVIPQLTGLFLTLYDEATGGIINTVDREDLLTSGRWTVVADKGALKFLPDDNVIVTASKKLERHVALLEWTWGIADEGHHEFLFTVRNMLLVPTPVPP